MSDSPCVAFLQWALPQLNLRWRGFRKVRRQVCKRIGRRMKRLGLASLDEYRAYLIEHPEEWGMLDSFCRITISRFYRDRGVFDFIRQVAMPTLAEAAQRRGEKELRIWSAGCASGEEVYTLSIAWRRELAPRFPNVALHLTATDADEKILDRARHGCYPPGSFKDMPPAWIEAAFRREEGEFCVKEEFRDGVQFLLQDIRREQPAGPFSLILCRHLAFTYFDESLQAQVLHNLLERLTPEGALVAGKQEPLPPGAANLLREWAPHTGVYVKRHANALSEPKPKTGESAGKR